MDQAASVSGGRGERTRDFGSRLQLLLDALDEPSALVDSDSDSS